MLIYRLVPSSSPSSCSPIGSQLDANSSAQEQLSVRLLSLSSRLSSSLFILFFFLLIALILFFIFPSFHPLSNTYTSTHNFTDVKGLVVNPSHRETDHNETRLSIKATSPDRSTDGPNQSPVWTYSNCASEWCEGRKKEWKTS